MSTLTTLILEYNYFNHVGHHGYVASDRSGQQLSSTTPCVVTSRLPTAAALHQLRRAPRLVVSRPQ
jgi:hypothetical protein